MAILQKMRAIWQDLPAAMQNHAEVVYLTLTGFVVGLVASSVIAIFRITNNAVFSRILRWTSPQERSFWIVALLFASAIAAALLVGRLIRNPAIRSGGAAWISKAIHDGQPNVWRIILFPKFIGSWLVIASGVSVGSEGPSIQMGAASALGLNRFSQQNKIERRFFILGGSAAGLSAAFTSPFAGICYVYEVMSEKMSSPLLTFLLAGGVGVYAGCSQIFGMGVLLPLPLSQMPDWRQIWLLLPLGVFAAGIGIVYNYLLRWSKRLYNEQKKIPFFFQPMFAFVGTAVLVLLYPAVTGEGLGIFPTIEAGQALAGSLCVFLGIKLLFTAYCYGSSIPAGVMVPLISVGGVSGAIYGDWLAWLGILSPEFGGCCIILGMAAAFAAAERAPLTACVLIAEMTGGWNLAPLLLLFGSIGVLLGRLAKVQDM